MHCVQCGSEMAIVMSDKNAVIWECLGCGIRFIKKQKRRQRRVGPSEVKE